jgi:hypothetical protein
MTASQATQKNFQRIDVDALERLLKVDAEVVQASSRMSLLGYIKDAFNKFFSH